ncbi:lasso peptide biosynthesis B2 protein [Brevibacillus antibioticus]|uniref:Lasso peptide biosynthesis B2 protein n=1 Tax=Brevibacillus antibioticus TaxID=2570228 RepID=A0A4U2Y302_9BACL|nr:lasso peptide biosynthesis B2 protein [Brevibacillus antibioticus]TKI54820.1 lasso peptide biosynthesis B2 protein [Brevibacillus antibioticus]
MKLSSGISSFLLIIEAIISLVVVWILLRLFKMKTINWRYETNRSNPALIRRIYNAIWTVSQYMPISCRCLEVASAVKFVAAVHRLKVTVVVGIKSCPFVSHAWINSHDLQMGVENPEDYKVIGEF